MIRVQPSVGNIFSIIGLCILVSYTGWLWRETTKSSIVLTADNQYPDFFAINVTATETSIKGVLKDKFITPKAVHYATNDTTFYDNPHIISYPDDGKSPWDITALHGKSINGTDKLILSDNVKIYEPAGPQNNDTWITTSWLVVYPKQNYAETDKPVTFIEPDLTVNSIGMRVYFKEKRIELLKQARGVYDETKTPKK
ncbi:MAG: LPS export ABC transporter periplasmic protein LptC [Legionellales bacterium]|nr:LPS export ABC transporter periplasmic protein LptC [Legionellales bacterium]